MVKKKKIFKSSLPFHLLLPQNVSFSFKFIYSFIFWNLILTVSKKKKIVFRKILLWLLFFCFVHHIEVGISPHQDTTSGGPGTSCAFKATFIPVSVGEVLLPSGYSVLSAPPERWSHFRNVWSDSSVYEASEETSGLTGKPLALFTFGSSKKK